MDLSIFRPAAPSSASIAEALERANPAQAEAVRQTNLAKEARDTLLLDGDATQLAAAEKALATARANVERAEAMVAQLTTRLAAAERGEVVERATSATRAYEEAHAARAKWWRKAGPQLQALLREGHSLERTLDTKINDLNRTRSTAQQGQPDFEPGRAEIDGQDSSRDWLERVAFWSKGLSFETPATVVRLRPWEITEPPASQPTDAPTARRTSAGKLDLPGMDGLSRRG